MISFSLVHLPAITWGLKLLIFLVAPKHNGSNAGNLDMHKGSFKVLLLRENESSHKLNLLWSTIKINILFVELWKWEKKFVLDFLCTSNYRSIGHDIWTAVVKMDKTLNLWEKDMNRKLVLIDSMGWARQHQACMETSARYPLKWVTLSHFLKERHGYTNSGISLAFLIIHKKKCE